METDNYFCLSGDGNIYFLGNHGDWEAAEDTAQNLGYNPIWVFGEESAKDWANTLDQHLKINC